MYGAPPNDASSYKPTLTGRHRPGPVACLTKSRTGGTTTALERRSPVGSCAGDNILTQPRQIVRALEVHEADAPLDRPVVEGVGDAVDAQQR